MVSFQLSVPYQNRGKKTSKFRILAMIVEYPGILYIMVFKLGGCSFYYAHVWCKIGLFRKKIGFDYSFDVTKCLQQIEIPILLQMCA